MLLNIMLFRGNLNNFIDFTRNAQRSSYYVAIEHAFQKEVYVLGILVHLYWRSYVTEQMPVTIG